MTKALKFKYPEVKFQTSNNNNRIFEGKKRKKNYCKTETNHTKCLQLQTHVKIKNTHQSSTLKQHHTKKQEKPIIFPPPKPPKHLKETISVGFKQCKLVGKFQHKALCADVKHKGSTRLTPLGFQATLP